MMLCEKDNINDIVNIYKLKEKKAELKRYKAALLLSQNKESLFYKFSTIEELKITNITRGGNIKLNSKYNDLSKDTYKSNYPFQDKQLIHECIISKFLNNELLNATMLSIDEKGKKNDFLITTDVKTSEFNNSFTLENLLKLSKELSTIQLIQSSNLSELYRRITTEKLNISEQLKYFSLKYIDSIDFKEVEKMHNCGLIDNKIYYDCKKKIDESFKILKLI